MLKNTPFLTQTVTQAWAARFITIPRLQSNPAGVVTDAAIAIAIDGAGNVVVTGAGTHTRSFGAGHLAPAGFIDGCFTGCLRHPATHKKVSFI